MSPPRSSGLNLPVRTSTSNPGRLRTLDIAANIVTDRERRLRVRVQHGQRGVEERFGGLAEDDRFDAARMRERCNERRRVEPEVIICIDARGTSKIHKMLR